MKRFVVGLFRFTKDDDIIADVACIFDTFKDLLDGCLEDLNLV